ncbi:hypothetical protein [Methanolacinia paynteri]|uniref:hypothetical protein n=1 Tax=Methanolacinia paynteri TaxID=230356 RepID=UPI00064FBBC0|nr:hypothetical protein [Methanolacinia paynteri]
MTAEWNTAAGLENNAEMIKTFYTHMVFDIGDIAEEDAAPANEVFRVAVSAVRNGQDIEWSATVNYGVCTEDTVVRALWMVGKDAGNNDVFLACNLINPVTLNPSTGMTFRFPYSVSGYSNSEA